MTSTPLPGQQQLKKGAARSGEEAILEAQLQLAVEVLTSKSCSEEGLEDATNLLLQLAKANTATRSAVVQLLLRGARELGMTVGAHIRQLIEETRSLSGAGGVDDATREEEEKEEEKASQKGVLRDRLYLNCCGSIVGKELTLTFLVPVPFHFVFVPIKFLVEIELKA